MRGSLSIVIGLLLASTALAADAPPTGTFEGTGFWRAADGSSGEYATRITISESRIVTEVEHEHQGARTERHVMALRSTGPGFYELLNEENEAVGQLFCLDGECSYGVRQDGGDVHESWRLSGSELQKFGGKSFGDFRVVWKEKLFAR